MQDLHCFILGSYAYRMHICKKIDTSRKIQLRRKLEQPLSKALFFSFTIKKNDSNYTDSISDRTRTKNKTPITDILTTKWTFQAFEFVLYFI